MNSSLDLNSHRTAITRKNLSVPVRWLLKHDLIYGNVLDYGCGRCQELNERLLSQHPDVYSVSSYDPYYAPSLSRAKWGVKWDVILCTYVLCVLPEELEHSVLDTIQTLLQPEGVAYITVREEPPKNGWGVSSRGTFQRHVDIPYLSVICQNRRFTIYSLTRTTQLPTIL